MKFIGLNHRFNFIGHSKTSFIIKLTHCKDIWLFNCCDGCQQSIVKQGIKINQISKIIITELNIEIISGLLGLLSSLNLSSRNKPLHIYAPLGLSEYIDLGKKYCHTNFCYSIYVHILRRGLIIDHMNYRIYTMLKYHYFEFIIVAREKYGKFSLNKANNFNIITGPLYGKLKHGFSFILPDGVVLNGYDFTDINDIGIKFVLIINLYHFRPSIENSLYVNLMQYKL
uniref:Ribonuclease Z n=1 Tax=Pterothamnion crispum TaxID=1550583 RepID=A0A4D6X021_9FLOR|nr:ribonuclease Z [Pterothamnion crispum]